MPSPPRGVCNPHASYLQRLAANFYKDRQAWTALPDCSKLRLAKQYETKGEPIFVEITAHLGCGGCYSRLIRGVYSGSLIVR